MRIITFCLTLIFLVTSASAAPKLINTAAIKGSNNVVPKSHGKKNNNTKNELLIAGLIALGAVGLIAILASSHSSSNHGGSPTPPPPPPPPSDSQTFEIVNNSGYPDANVFVSVVGTNGHCDWNNLGQCILNTETTSEISGISLTNLPVTTGASYQATDKPSLKANLPRLVYLGDTLFDGAKLFITVDSNKAIPVDFTGSGYTTPLPFNTGYGDKKYDYVEFARTSNPDADIIDLTAVDFFGLSLKIADKNGLTAGFNGTSTATIHSDVVAAFNAAGTYHTEWNSKLIPDSITTHSILNPSVVGAGDADFGTSGTILNSVITSIKNKDTAFSVADKDGHVYTDKATINNTDKTIDINASETGHGTIKLKLEDLVHPEYGFNTFSVFANDVKPTDSSPSDEATDFHGSIPAAILRGVFDTPANWNTPGTYTYQSIVAPTNDLVDPFAKALHDAAIDHKYYAMGFDDIGDNASRLYFKKSVLPITITINPY